MLTNLNMASIYSIRIAAFNRHANSKYFMLEPDITSFMWNNLITASIYSVQIAAINK
jgi:hypothetical protein